MNLADVADQLLEVSVVPSFTRVGFDVRSRLDRWEAPQGDLAGHTIVVTGATSGLGRQAAQELAMLGAHVVLCGRDRAKAERVRTELSAYTGSTELSVACADMGRLDQVRQMVDDIVTAHPKLDGLVHNAGALAAQRSENAAGIEMTVASQVLGPFLLTGSLLPTLSDARPGRVVTVSSGGMYTARVDVEHLEMEPTDYRGSEQYARAKRAQVTLNEMWAERVPRASVVFHALHPGWADTPGIESALPRFRRVLRPLLRTPAQGVDTLLWLMVDDGDPVHTSGMFWHDRRRRAIHRLPSTRRSDTPERRRALWDWCVAQTGVGAVA